MKLDYMENKVSKKLEGFWIGTVVDNSDPKKLNRIKVQVRELSNKIDKEYLPWYPCVIPPNANPNSKNFIPTKGSEVYVIFPDNNFYNGFVLSQLPYDPPE
jgi:hypothetical protein